MSDHVDYNAIAPTYDLRYSAGPMPGVRTALQDLARDLRAERVLELGCGTGHWLAELQPVVRSAFGLDLSPGMLAHARARARQARLVLGRGDRLPYAPASFDLVYCVNALHHFDDQRGAVFQARRLLRPGGALAAIGADPHSGQDRWFVYDYFPGALAIDLRRFPSAGTLIDWLLAAGFTRVERRVVHHIYDPHLGRAVLQNHFLRKSATSQLTLLSDEDYAAGIARLHADLAQAETQGQTLRFEVDLRMAMVLANA